jgi:hypothetical protein
MAFYEITLRYFGDRPKDNVQARRVKSADAVEEAPKVLWEALNQLAETIQGKRAADRAARRGD